jgi:hypothetical protein
VALVRGGVRSARAGRRGEQQCDELRGDYHNCQSVGGGHHHAMQTCLPPLFDLIRLCPCCLPWATTALLSPDSNFAERACSCARGHSSQGGASLTRAASPNEPALGNKRTEIWRDTQRYCER